MMAQNDRAGDYMIIRYISFCPDSDISDIEVKLTVTVTVTVTVTMTVTVFLHVSASDFALR